MNDSRKTLPFLVAGLLSVLVFADVTIGQSRDESLKLNKRVVELYSTGDLDEAIPVATKVVAVERKLAADSSQLVSALENLGRLKLDRYKRSTSTVASDEATYKRLAALSRSDIADAEEHLREAVNISGLAKNVTASQNVSLRTSLAWIIQRSGPRFTPDALGFEKSARDKLEMQLKAADQKSASEAVRLYKEAIDLARGSGEPIPLMTALFSKAEFDVGRGDVVSGTALYKELLELISKSFGRKDPQQIPVLEGYSVLLSAIGREDELFDVVSKIGMVSGKTAAFPKTLINLTNASPNAFAPVVSDKVEGDSKSLKATADLAGRRAVTNASAAGGDVSGLALGTSMDGRAIYETSTARSIRAVTVRVRVQLNESGKVTEAKGIHPDADLSRSAEKAVQQWTFRPAVIDGTPVKLTGFVECFVLTN